MAFVTIANALVVLACFKAAIASQVSFQLDEEAIKNRALPECRIRQRSNAANKQTIWAFSGESITFTICPKESGHVSFDNVIYSNDGWVDNVSVLFDDVEIGKFVSTDTSNKGELWNVFHESGFVGKTYLTPGKHIVTVSVRQADKWGIEFDELVLQFDKDWTADDIKCPDEVSNYGSRAPAYGAGYDVKDVPCFVDENDPVKAMMPVQNNDGKTTTTADVPETSTTKLHNNTNDTTTLKPDVPETSISTESPTKTNDKSTPNAYNTETSPTTKQPTKTNEQTTKSDVSETTTTKQSTTAKDKTTTKADIPETSSTTTTTTGKSPIKSNSSVSLTNPNGEDMTIERVNVSFCSGGLAHFDVLSTLTTQISLKFSPPKQASMSPHSSFHMASDPVEMYSSDSAHVQGYPGSQEGMWVSMGDSEPVPCSAIQLSAPDAKGNMSSRLLMTSDGGMHIFPASSATSQAVFYPPMPHVASGEPGMNVASVKITSDGSTFDLHLQTELAEMKISVGLHVPATTLTFYSRISRLTSLAFPCDSDVTKVYVAGDDGVFYSMLGNWKSLVGTKLHLRMETD